MGLGTLHYEEFIATNWGEGQVDEDISQWQGNLLSLNM